MPKGIYKHKKGWHHREESKIKMSIHHLGLKPMLGKHHTKETKLKIAKKLRKQTELEAIINGKIKRWNRWLKFRKNILERDNYICKVCNKVANQIHHLKMKEKFPELCWDENNVISICDYCHKKIHWKNRLKF